MRNCSIVTLFYCYNSPFEPIPKCHYEATSRAPKQSCIQMRLLRSLLFPRNDNIPLNPCLPVDRGLGVCEFAIVLLLHCTIVIIPLSRGDFLGQQAESSPRRNMKKVFTSMIKSKNNDQFSM